MATSKLKAFKIIPQTYPAYLNFPGIIHLSLEHINNKFFVIDPELPNGRGWFDERDFRERYKFVGDVSFTDFTEVVRVPETDY